jgi:hypothetical protein
MPDSYCSRRDREKQRRGKRPTTHFIWSDRVQGQVGRYLGSSLGISSFSLTCVPRSWRHVVFDLQTKLSTW